MSSFLTIALQCAARVGSFPLVPRDKYPRIAKKDGGRGFHDGTTSEEHIRTWWAAYLTSNVGIACGMSGLLVYDVDTGLRDDAHFEEWRIRNGLPETYTVRTGKRPEFRVQMYYLGSAKDGKFDLDGCCGDIKSEGGLVWPLQRHRTVRSTKFSEIKNWSRHRQLSKHRGERK